MIWLLRHGDAGEGAGGDDASRRLPAKGERQARAAGLALARLEVARRDLADNLEPTDLAEKTALAGLQRNLEQSGLSDGGASPADTLRQLASRAGELTPTEAEQLASQLAERADDFAGVNNEVAESLSAAASALSDQASGRSGSASSASALRSAADAVAASETASAEAAASQAGAAAAAEAQQRLGQGQGQGQGVTYRRRLRRRPLLAAGGRSAGPGSGLRGRRAGRSWCRQPA